MEYQSTLENLLLCGGDKVCCGPGGNFRASRHYKRGKRQGIQDNPTIIARDRDMRDERANI